MKFMQVEEEVQAERFTLREGETWIDAAHRIATVCVAPGFSLRYFNRNVTGVNVDGSRGCVAVGLDDWVVWTPSKAGHSLALDVQTDDEFKKKYREKSDA